MSINLRFVQTSVILVEVFARLNEGQTEGQHNLFEIVNIGT